MRVLVIPDVHLKPWMFINAARLMNEKIAARAVCLMDIADDWNQQYNKNLYEDTYDAAISFAKKYPDTMWCWGNHDLSYQWNQLETGYSPMAEYTVNRKLIDLKEVLSLEDNAIQYVGRIDNVLFSHGGLSKAFVEEHVPLSKYTDVDYVLKEINSLGKKDIWNDISPIWLRPQYENVKMYKPRTLLQVVGHTPMRKITKSGHVISCDVFSTYPDGKPIGTEEFLLLDTISWEFKGINL